MRGSGSSSKKPRSRIRATAPDCFPPPNRKRNAPGAPPPKPADPLWTKSGEWMGRSSRNRPRSIRFTAIAPPRAIPSRACARRRLPRGRPSAWLLVAILLALILAGSGFAYLYSNRPQGVELPDPEIAQQSRQSGGRTGRQRSGSRSRPRFPPRSERLPSASRPTCLPRSWRCSKPRFCKRAIRSMACCA